MNLDDKYAVAALACIRATKPLIDGATDQELLAALRGLNGKLDDFALGAMRVISALLPDLPPAPQPEEPKP